MRLVISLMTDVLTHIQDSNVLWRVIYSKCDSITIVWCKHHQQKVQSYINIEQQHANDI